RSCRYPAARGRRCCATWWSCRQRSAPESQRTRQRRRPDRCRPAPVPHRSAWSARGPAIASLSPVPPARWQRWHLASLTAPSSMVGVFGPNATPRHACLHAPCGLACTPWPCPAAASILVRTGGRPSVLPASREVAMAEARNSEQALLAERLATFAERSQNVVQQFWRNQAEAAGEGSYAVPDPKIVGRVFFELGTRRFADPSRLVEAQLRLWRDQAELWQNTLARMQGAQVEPLVEPERGDRRFKDE